MRSNIALRVTLIAIAVAALLVGVAWTTEIRAALHGGLIALCVFAFLPFVVIASIVGLVVVVALLAGLAGGDGAADAAHLAEGFRYSAWGVRKYYGFLARHRGSSWIGVPIGMLLGTLVVWALLAVFVLPKELRTTELLLGLKGEIEKQYAASKSYPPPQSGNTILGSSQEVVRDAFDRALHYEVRGRWRLASYRLTSYGSDGVPSSDDLCIEGQTKLQDLLDTSAALIGFAELARFRGGTPISDRLDTLRAVQCERAAITQ